MEVLQYGRRGYSTLIDTFHVHGAQVLVDCANGVGAPALQRLAAALQRKPSPAAALRMRLVNKGGGGLNESCGADFVQKERSLPSGFQAALDVMPGAPRRVPTRSAPPPPPPPLPVIP